MAVSPRTFKRDLYQEHVEEASFLYTQRLVLLEDPEVSWLRLRDFEQRLEAHLDALVIGGAPAARLCRDRAVCGDSGELFAAVSVLCRHRDSAGFAALWRAVDLGDPVKARAFTDALKFELPFAWQPACEKAIAHSDPLLVAALSSACAYRQLPVAEVLAARLRAEPDLMSPATMLALSGMPHSSSTVQVLEVGYRHADPLVRQQAARGLLRSGVRTIVEECEVLAATEEWPQMILGLAGNRTSATVLRHRVEAGDATTATFHALALLGDLSTVRVLCAALADEELKAAAALALRWITGAPLYENAFVPEPVDERELLAEELAAWRERGIIPKRADGSPFGTQVQQVNADAQVWNQWLAQHARRFRPDTRYRLGQPYSASAALRGLLDPLAPLAMRQFAADELAVRFGCTISFACDLQVAEQHRKLRAVALWVEENAARFAVGGWSTAT